MNDTDNMDKTGDIYDKLAAMVAVGDEDAAREYLADHFAELPEELQGKVALALFADAMKAEVAEREVVADIQEKGLQAAEAIEKANGRPAGESIDK